MMSGVDFAREFASDLALGGIEVGQEWPREPDGSGSTTSSVV